MHAKLRINIQGSESEISINDTERLLLLDGVDADHGHASQRWIENFERLMARRLLSLSIKERKPVMSVTFMPIVNAYRRAPTSVTWKLD